MSLLTVNDRIDPHHHLWSPKTHSWLEKIAESGHPAGPFKSILQYEVEEYMNDCATFNVSKSVHVQAHFDGEPIEETKYLQDVADKHGFPHGIVAYADLASPDVNALLKEHCKYANVRGIRQMLDYHPVEEKWRQAPHDRFLTDDTWLTGLKLMEQYNLSFDLQIHVPQMQAAAAVARSHPNIQFIINHGGFPAELDEQAIAAWKEGLSALAAHDNVAVKLSGFNMFHNSWNKELLHPLVEFPINTFSTSRCMFASNFPVDKIHANYHDLMECYASICTDMGLTQEDANKLFRDNAARIYRV